MEVGQGQKWGCSAKEKKSCPCAEVIKHYAMKAYGEVDV
jgi:hypothetical protein